ncbi:hypothetical protein D3C73_1390510 [compost metagenome]
MRPSPSAATPSNESPLASVSTDVQWLPPSSVRINVPPWPTATPISALANATPERVRVVSERTERHSRELSSAIITTPRSPTATRCSPLSAMLSRNT